MKIAHCLKRVDWRDPYVASDRIRGEWVMRHCPYPHTMEIWESIGSYDAVIYHNVRPRILKGSELKILDVCDPLWRMGEQRFKEQTLPLAGVVAASEELAKGIKELLKVPVRVIGDGHDFEFYEKQRLPNPHERPAKTVVWFGYPQNQWPLDPLLEVLKAHGLRLKLISTQSRFQDPIVDFVPWELETYIREISQADFALLPFTTSYKTNNKDISALLSGVPVAKTPEDIARLIDSAERRRDMALAPGIIAKHHVRDRARDYVNFVLELKGESPIPVHSHSGERRSRVDAQ